MIHIIRQKATQQQIDEMLQDSTIKQQVETITRQLLEGA
jgi:hypothetical protein